MNEQPDGNLLVLRYEGLSERIEAAYAQLSVDDALQRQFVADPARFIDERVVGLPEGTSTADRSKANAVLFALLSNDAFLKWANEWHDRHADEIDAVGDELAIRLDKDALLQELAEAVWTFADRELVVALLGLDAEVGVHEADSSEFGTPPNVGIHTRIPRPVPVNVNTQINVNIMYTVTVILLAVAVIPVAIIGAARPRFGVSRADLRQVTEVVSVALVEHARTLRAAGQLGPRTT
jgi:hypothetical protein